MKNGFILIRGPRLLWSQFKAGLWSMFKLERIVTYSEARSLRILPWFPVFLRVVLIEGETSKKVFWTNPMLSDEEVQAFKSKLDAYRASALEALKSEGL